MVRLVIVEFRKLRHSWILISAVLGSAVSPLMSSLMYYSAAHRSHEFLYSSIYAQNFLFGSLLVNVLLYSLIASFLLYREYQEKTLSSVLTIPVSRTALLTVKIIVSVGLALGLSLLSGVFASLGGWVLGAKGWSVDLAVEALAVLAKSALIQTPCLVAILWITMLSKNYFVPIGASIVAVILNIFLMNAEVYAHLFPWLHPFLLALVPGDQGVHLVPDKMVVGWGVWGGFTVLTTAGAYATFLAADTE